MKKIILFAAFFLIFVSLPAKAEPGIRTGVTFNFFYSSLSPYGEWIQMNNDVFAWHPLHMRSDWVPYSVGRWYWTAQGWCWDSFEPFGWATFHYGRWFYDDYYGWIWIPGYDWAPAWVEWRYNDNYIGWAPLPPYATFGADFGIRFSIGWHSPYRYWNFMPYKHFCGYDVGNYLVADRYKNGIFSHTKYRDDYGYKDGRIINHGIDRDFVERRSGNKITERQLVETTNLRNNMGTRNSEGNRIEIFRPSESEINKARDIQKFDFKRNDRKTSLEASKVEFKDRVRPEIKNPEIRTKESIHENPKVNNRINKEPAKVEIKREVKKSPEINRNTNRPEKVQTNANRNENKTIEKKKVIEKKPESNVNRTMEKKTGVNRNEGTNVENRRMPGKEVRVQENNKPRKEAPRVENRTPEKRNTNISKRGNSGVRKVEPGRKEANGSNRGVANNDRGRRK
jgi:hypothetical protein